MKNNRCSIQGIQTLQSALFTKQMASCHVISAENNSWMQVICTRYKVFQKQVKFS